MSYSYDRVERTRRQTYGASTRRSTLGYWIPLALTVTVATVGIAAWIWSERKDDDDEEYYDRKDNDRRAGDRPPPGYDDAGPGQPPYHHGAEGQGPPVEDQGMLARMSGAIRRTPSPQQIFDGASRRVVAGVTAAGAVVGGALSSIREEDRQDFEDHSRWSEEAESRAGEATSSSQASRPRRASQPGAKPGKRKTVAIVLSADTDYHARSEEVSYHQEHASILSHLPHHIDDDSRVFILIHAPDLKQHPLAGSQQPGQPSSSTTSSYSNIGHDDARGHDDDEKPLVMVDPQPETSPPRSGKFNALYAEAQALVEKDTMIMPFTTQEGHVHLLRHLGPEIVYIQETLTGDKGEAISNMKNWVGQIVIVVGDESGHGGLVDSEDERGHSGESREKWWQHDPMIGLGKGVEVVEGLRIGEDWRRRCGGHD